jgi:hypothetical protein
VYPLCTRAAIHHFTSCSLCFYTKFSHTSCLAFPERTAWNLAGVICGFLGLRNSLCMAHVHFCLLDLHVHWNGSGIVKETWLV